MTIPGPTKNITFGVVLTSIFLLVALLIPAPAAEASSQYHTPCPSYSIQDVFDDPSGNWDGDLVRNADELYNGLNPCIVDTTEFCAGGGNPLCHYPTSHYSYYPSACLASVNAYPNGDYDGDGVSNSVEVNNGANPCAHPCPHPTNADLALNPNGSWDQDGISNAIEVSQGTNPCNGYAYNPCPHYSYYQVDFMPGYDWDGDGVSNANEVKRGTNPCSADYGYYAPTTTVHRLPHVSTPKPRPVYIPPKPPITVCPHGYPYYHPGNGLCYANPIGHYYPY